MSLLLGQPPQLCLRQPVIVRASSPLLSNGSSSSLLRTPPCIILGVDQCDMDLGKLFIKYANAEEAILLDKKVPMELVWDRTGEIVTIGTSHGWVASLNDDGVMRLQDDLNPAASDLDPKRISLPPLVTLPHCQTQIVTNVAMSSPCPEEEDCVVAVKFLGPQLSFCRPGQRNPEWINIGIANPCFFSSRVMFSKKHDMFCIPGSGGHLIGSWDLHKHKYTPKLQKLQHQNLPELTKTTRDLLHFCCTTVHLVESRSTGETFLVKLYKNIAEIIKGIAKTNTEALMVFRLDEQGNAVYTKDIGDLCIFLSKSEPFCVPASSFPGLFRNHIYIFGSDEFGIVSLKCSNVAGRIFKAGPSLTHYIMPPRIID